MLHNATLLHCTEKNSLRKCCNSYSLSNNCDYLVEILFRREMKFSHCFNYVINDLTRSKYIEGNCDVWKYSIKMNYLNMQLSMNYKIDRGGWIIPKQFSIVKFHQNHVQSKQKHDFISCMCADMLLLLIL